MAQDGTRVSSLAVPKVGGSLLYPQRRRAVIIIAVVCISVISLVVGLIYQQIHKGSQTVMTEGPTNLSLKPGEQYALRLRGLGTAGYSWVFTIERSDQIVRVELVPVEHSLPGSPSGPPPTAGSVDAVYLITALEPGHVTIRFIQQRSWERNKPPLKEYVLSVDVQP
jgi:predicted secreted protein